MRLHRQAPASGFTILEVMIATLVLAVGISAAIGTIVNNNNYRKSLDENALADLVLRQMAARLKITSLSLLGQVYAHTPNAATPTVQVAQPWTLHLRATASTLVPAATPGAAALAQPYTSPIAYPPPFRPLVQRDLIDAGIISDAVGLLGLNMYVEYYNLSTVTGLQNVNGMLVPVENGLIKHFNELQDASPTGSPLKAWYSLVGDPDLSHTSLPNGQPPTDALADSIIMPITFSTANVNFPNAPSQVIGANSHGVAIRILISWIPAEVAALNVAKPYRQWRETVIVKGD